jgi:hypothetical protein
MSIDLFVMPLWRFKAGDFRSPIEVQLGIRPRIATAEGIESHPRPPSWISRWRAKRDVAKLKRFVARANGVPIDWKDEGDVVYSGQTYGMTPLKAYAHWLDCREKMPGFDPPSDHDYDRHPVFSIEINRTSFPQLIEHDCYNGYFLPVEFSSVVEAEPYLIFGNWPATRSVGSSPMLRRELDRMQEDLQVPEPYDYSQDDPLIAVRAAYLTIRKAVDLSCQHGLPMIFWG